MTVKFGKVTRKISLSEFTGLIAEYDITDKLDVSIDGTINLEMLYELSDEYVAQFLE